MTRRWGWLAWPRQSWARRSLRWPSAAFLEHIFVDVGKARQGKITLARRTMDEVYTVLALLPLLVMNLRAQFDVMITDASPTGGGGAVATQFKIEPVLHDGRHCAQCGERLETDRTYPCPTWCGVGLCSLHCIFAHRDGACKRHRYMVPKFGERFSGPNAPHRGHRGAGLRATWSEEMISLWTRARPSSRNSKGILPWLLSIGHRSANSFREPEEDQCAWTTAP